MDVQTIIRLLDAGYSREEIDALNDPNIAAASTILPAAGDAPAVSGQDPEPVPGSKGAESSGSSASHLPDAPEQPAATSSPDIDKLKTMIDGLNQQLQQLTKVVHTNNIINSEQPAKPVQTAADILASIINPYTSKGE